MIEGLSLNVQLSVDRNIAAHGFALVRDHGEELKAIIKSDDDEFTMLHKVTGVIKSGGGGVIKSGGGDDGGDDGDGFGNCDLLCIAELIIVVYFIIKTQGMP